WIALASALIAAVGLIFTGQQVMLLNRQPREDRQLALKGDVVYWRAESDPTSANEDGTGSWKNKITVSNTGKLPNDHVQMSWRFRCPVERVHGDGTVEAPTKEIKIFVPVLPGGVEHARNRWLRINYADAQRDLPHTYAEVVFRDVTGTRRVNRWPREFPPERRDRDRKSTRLNSSH